MGLPSIVESPVVEGQGPVGPSRSVSALAPVGRGVVIPGRGGSQRGSGSGFHGRSGPDRGQLYAVVHQDVPTSDTETARGMFVGL